MQSNAEYLFFFQPWDEKKTTSNYVFTKLQFNSIFSTQTIYITHICHAVSLGDIKLKEIK